MIDHVVWLLLVTSCAAQVFRPTNFCLNPQVQGYCKNGATCVPQAVSVSCQCTPEYTGATCDTPLNQSQTTTQSIDQSQTSTQSVDQSQTSTPSVDQSQTSTPSVETSQTSTQAVVVETDSTSTTRSSGICAQLPYNPCQNGGTCIARGFSFACACPSDFTSADCSVAIVTPGVSTSISTTQQSTGTSVKTTVTTQAITENGTNTPCNPLILGALCEEGVECNGNIWQCKPNYGGDRCCTKCSEPCIGNGRCGTQMINGSRVPACICDPYFRYDPTHGCLYRCDLRYEADYCDEPDDGKSSLRIAVGVSLGLLALALIALAVVIYLLWRRRVHWVQKIIYPLLPYVDDPNKACAYVSHSDEGVGNRFVYDKLLPVLEDERKHKLLIHHRDAILGMPIHENIMEAIDKSSRVILIMTRDFTTSEWRLFCSQAALQQMYRRKTGIIPILLDDVTDDRDLDPSLRYLLSSVTSIRAPLDDRDTDSPNWKKFWDRVHYSLPKIRNDSKEVVEEEKENTTGALVIQAEERPPSPSFEVKDISINIQPDHQNDYTDGNDRSLLNNQDSPPVHNDNPTPVGHVENNQPPTEDHIYSDINRDEMNTFVLGNPLEQPQSINNQYTIVGSINSTDRRLPAPPAENRTNLPTLSDLGYDIINHDQPHRTLSGNIKNVTTEDTTL